MHVFKNTGNCSVGCCTALLKRGKGSHNWTGVQKLVSECVLHINMNFRSAKKWEK